MCMVIRFVIRSVHLLIIIIYTILTLQTFKNKMKSEWHIFIGLFCPFKTISIICIHFVYNLSCTSRYTTEYKDTSDCRQYIDAKYTGTYQITSTLRSCSLDKILIEVVFGLNFSSRA